MFTKAILRKPCMNMVDGLRSDDLGVPDYELALHQHAKYNEALQECGLDTIVLDPDENYPDSVFIEDVALLTPACAIITRPGAESRRGETHSMRHLLSKYYTSIYEIAEPGTVEAGDIMMAGKHFYIGLSGRTNLDGAMQVISYLRENGMTGSTIKLERVLHLKTGLSYIENNNLVASGEFLLKNDFKNFNMIEINDDESYAANCIWVNGTVIIPEGYPGAMQKIESAAYNIITLDMSEFRKLDGGLSCLSLRF